MIESPADITLDCALAELGFSWDALTRQADEIILFGSRATGLERPDSDWDLVCVGPGRSRSSKLVDLVWVAPEQLGTERWLTSELAGHLARYGRWLHGRPAWLASVRPGPAAAADKARRLASRLAAIERVWDILPPPSRQEYQTLVRRDLQRYALLSRGEPVPPTRLLDEAWHAQTDPLGELLHQARMASVCSSFFAEMMTGQLCLAGTEHQLLRIPRHRSADGTLPKHVAWPSIG